MNKNIPKKLVDVIIPTYNNPQYLQPCIESLFNHTAQSNYLKVFIINNGHSASLDKIPADGENIIIHQAGENLGWEGGLQKGLELGNSEFVLFLNDDTSFFPAASLWLAQMLAIFLDPKVAAAGPSSNVVSGWQNAFIACGGQALETDYLIGFCMMIRRKYLLEVGGIDVNMPGGDDFDLSIRLRKAGYKLLALRNAFVYHHGFITGTRLRGAHNVIGGWNSPEMQNKTNAALIRKHGFFDFWQTLSCAGTKPYAPNNDYSMPNAVEDIEGITIRNLIEVCGFKTKQSKIIELGCGGKKTFDTAIGVDIVPFGRFMPAFQGLGENIKSVADICADISLQLPEQCNDADVIIARHILEHITDTAAVIQNWKKTLKDKGILILAVPNEEICSTIPLNPEHVHAYTPDSLDSLMILAGFKRMFLKRKLNGISFIAVYQKIEIVAEKKTSEKENNLQSVR